ncbi:hypothetical protein [Dyadobacter pollutisoli]|jgi:hypothetical protein|uniref:Uncharacterized protein n=1 Tax=Dyadobacter pollutisoli TaxID=2910158 RepID=A0A9E8NBC5_9BACT|nr:hypothetical protein [Dyadobacter pollutisoli]WAC13510.1 hypothetical protein ON006_06045 [Dyadobacter pollutisoli]
MKIGAKLLKVLSKKYVPGEMIDQKFERYDISFKTDHEGNPVLLFVGTRGREGQIRGERFVRVVIRDQNGQILKDHWDAKGKT